MPKRKNYRSHSTDMDAPKRRATEDELDPSASHEAESPVSPDEVEVDIDYEDEESSALAEDDDDISMKWKKMTLIDSLKAILKDYPGNEQVLKELIQNAEDAGAKEIKFLYDAEEYPKDGLVDETLCEFQGPALYAFNDAVFTDEDFQNLVSIQNSKKSIDRSKVGRFGRGFKSVFHMTELPCVLSGKYLGKINPTKEDEDLIYKHNKLLQENPNELAPYLGKFDFSEATCKRGFYKGTIFRFPLRRAGCTYNVSDTIYSTEKVHNIFETLTTQAPMNLLFLKSLQKIEVFTREPHGECLRKLCVSVSNDTDKRLMERVRFFKDLCESKELPKEERHVVYQIDLQSSLGCHTGAETVKSYLVCHYYNSVRVSPNLEKLLSNTELCYNPIVSVAMPLTREIPDDDKPVNDGHLFCFLPLPVDGKASPTGLPIHINGFFAVDSKRSKLDWPTDQDVMTDLPPELAWNRCLVTELLPEAYALLLDAARREQCLQGHNIYHMFPNASEVNEKWQDTLLPPFFSRALKMPLFPSVGGSGQYMTLDDTVVCPPKITGELRDVLIKVLNCDGKDVVCPPEHVMDAISRMYCRPVEVTPCYVLALLKENGSYKTLTRAEKLCLLKFVIEGDAFGDLDGLELLPVGNGEFVAFHRDGEQIYIVEEEKRKLLPSLERLMLHSDLDPLVQEKLRSPACCDKIQLRLCSDEDYVKLLSRVFPGSCREDETIDCSKDVRFQHLTYDWVKQVWQFLSGISDSIPSSLKEMERLHILPIIPADGTTSALTLAKLHGSIPYLMSKVHDVTLETEVESLLQYFGIQVLHVIPDFVQHHPQIFDDDYIFQPHPESVMKALVKSLQVSGASVAEIVEDFNVNTSDVQRKSFSVFLQPVLKSADARFVALLRQLKIFETIGNYGGSCEPFAAAVDVNVGICNYSLPVKPSKVLLDLSSEGAQVLAKELGVITMTETEILEVCIFDDIRSHMWCEADVEKVMKLVLQNLDTHSQRSGTFLAGLKELKFIVDKNGNWLTTSDMFDPEDGHLKKLFIGEDKFPGCAYTPFLPALRQLGLKTEQGVTANDIVSSARFIHEKGDASNFDDMEKKAKAIGMFLQKQDHLLTRNALAELCDLEWIPVQVTKPNSFPVAYPWELTGRLFGMPKHMYPASYINVIGASLPTVKTGTISDEVMNVLQDSPVTLPALVSHLGKVVSSYTASEKPSYMNMAIGVYRALKELDVNQVRNELDKLDCWVWHGNGFTSADCVVTNQMSIEDLHPYIYRIPDELSDFKDWLLHLHVRATVGLPTVLEKIQQWHLENRTVASEQKIKNDEALVVCILNKVAEEQEKGDLGNIQGHILVPITDEDGLTLLPAGKCTYCDDKMDSSEMSSLQKTFQDDEEPLCYLHPNVPKATAKALGVKLLDYGRLFDNSGFDFASEIEECGQEESLTRRIRGLLDENYRDGLVIPKEVIQNADDAGATEVRFLFDERQNEDWRTGLLDDGMAKHQGPALWVYNDATFTDEDLANIRKLSGATKSEKRDKIGQFGLGFNAVYNITDVPSFITREFIVIFDPHKSNLGRVLQNNDPGLKINLCAGTKRMALLKKQFTNQFRPYNGIFECSVNQESNQEPYKGTLFRLPLRPPDAKSELKFDAYSRSDVQKLLQVLVEQANQLMLFTQNVKRIGVYHLPADAQDPSHPVRLFEAECCITNIFQEIPIPISHNGESFGILKYADMLYRNDVQLPSEKVSSATMVETKSTLFPYRKQGSDCLVLSGKSSTQHWLLCSCVGRHRSFQLGQKLKSCCPVAGVAVELDKMSEELCVPKVYDSGAPLFCHMPLPSTIRSGLPLIVNGSFAVMTDRQHLLEQTKDDTSEDTKYQWNAALMEDAIVEAYLGTLEQVTSCIDVGSCDPYSLWPVKETLSTSFKPFYESFYSEIAGGQGNHQKILYSAKGWIDFEHAMFLDKEIAESPLKDLALSLVQEYLDSHTPGKGVVVLPERIRQGFSDLSNKTFTLLQFYQLAFFPRMREVEKPGRDQLVEFALARCKEHPDLQQLMRATACIEVEGTSTKFLKPGKLILPSGKCGKLYDVEDHRFPISRFRKDKYADVLKLLGMAVDEIAWDEVVSRAATVRELQKERRWSRTQEILAHIAGKYEKNQPSSLILAQLKDMKFLPILPKPNSCPISWKGSTLEDDTVLSASEMYTDTHLVLVGNRRLILDEKRCGLLGNYDRKRTIFQLLGLNEKRPSLEDVIGTLDEVALLKVDSRNKHDVQNYCKKVYNYLNDYCCRGPTQVSQVGNRLRGKKCILVQTRFMESQHIAQKNFYKILPPYLSKVPDTIPAGCEKLLQAMQIKEEFAQCDYIEALHRMKDDGLSESDISIVRDVAESLEICRSLGVGEAANQTATTKPVLLPADTESHGTQMKLPQVAKLEFLPVDKLCLRENSKSWLMLSDQNLVYVHRTIPHRVAGDLGVKSDCENIISNLGLELGQPFGQKEELTTRINGILKGYPCDSGILKELLQNADDAGASELKFIFDPAGQRGDRVLSEEWYELQGPALCIYNNKPFTEKDLKGICSLGLGSKNMDPTKTGQYGIGFNSVYHLTDVPSFLTDGEEIGRTVGILDPNCRYVPGASSQYPGRCFQKEQLDKVASLFPDSFSGYLEDEYPSKGATMFRLPLRTVTAADKSAISKEPVEANDVQGFFDTLQKDVFKSLLFVNSVRDIEFVNRANREQDYRVHVSITEDDEKALAAFTKHMKEVSARLKSRDMKLSDVEYEDVVYTLRFEDSKKRKEEWSVCQSLGFENAVIPENVQAAYRNGDISLLPRGGAAFCKSKKGSQTHSMFCFLPLPVETKLPFHINGHFALDPNRRGLWGPSDGCYRTSWNKLILEACIAKACNSLIQVECAPLKKMGNMERCPNMGQLKKLYTLFPDVYQTDKDSYMYARVLASGFYKEMASSGSTCLAALAMTDSGLECRWFSVQDCIEGKVVFNNPNLEPKKEPKKVESPLKQDGQKELKVSEMLSRLGYNILEAVPQFIYGALRSIDKDVLQVTGKRVLKFLRQYKEHPQSMIKNLPLHISDTPFMNKINLAKMISCCLLADYSGSLSGLPLCLTQDMMLRVFDRGALVFTPMFSSLIRERADLFMHWDIYKKLPIHSLGNEDFPVNGLTVGKFASLLKEIPAYRQFLQERFQWDPSSENGKAIQKWLQELWRLIGQELGNTSPLNLKLVWVQLKPLLDFCILPTYIEHSGQQVHVLYRIQDANQVLHPYRLSRTFQDILPLLRSIGVPLLHLESCAEKDILTTVAIAPEIVTRQEDAVGTLNALWHLHRRQLLPVISKEQAESLLEYFSNYVRDYERRRSSVDQLPQLPSSQLLALPIHITISGNVVSLEGCAVYLIPLEMPQAGLESCFSDRMSVKFIFKRYKDLVNMYVGCGCCNKDEVELYTQVLLLKMHFCALNDDERLIHLWFISDHILPRLDEDSTKYKALLSSLQHLPFVTDTQGNLRQAKELYNPQVPVYAKMEKDFPSKKYTEGSLLNLLIKCCLNTEVTPDELVKYAEMVEEEAQADATEKTVDKAKLIYKELKVMADELTNEYFLKLKVISFLPVERCESELTGLHSQHLMPDGVALAFTCFQDSVLYQDRNKSWTVAPVLPSWVKAPKDMKYAMEKLGVQHPLFPQTAVSHCVKLANHLASQNMAQKKPAEVMKCMKASYEYLQERNDSLDTGMVRDLSRTPIICVDGGDSMIRPGLVVLGLKNEMKPYLYKLPLDLCPYFETLLSKLGVRDQTNYKHYMRILKVIHEDCQSGDPELDCNQQNSVKAAAKNFMTEISKEEELNIQPGEILYLPSQRKTLEQSTEMAAVDDPRLLPEDVARLDCHVVDDSLDLSVHELQMLPETLRPKLLSNFVEEILESNIKTSAVQATSYGDLCLFRSRLHSAGFLESLKRLLRHDASKRRENLDVFGKDWSVLEDTLKTVAFFTVPKIVTVLRSRSSNAVIPNSEKESSKVFMSKGTGSRVLYIQQMEEGQMLVKAQQEMAKYISAIMRVLSESALLLSSILSCPMNQISEVLDESGVSRSTETRNSDEPELGGFIPLVQHCLLQPDFVTFLDGEIVGLECDDPLNSGMVGEATYLYAKIIRCIRPADEAEDMSLKYEVDLGNSTKVVSATDLYKFTRKRAVISTQDKPTDLAKIKKSITADLTHAFNSLNEDEQKKFLKRLIMKWQREDNAELSAASLKFIEEEIERIPREAIKDENGATGSTGWRNHPWYSSRHIFQYARERSNLQREQISQYQQESSRCSSPLNFSYLRYRGKNPQPGEARRWYRQAKCDLQASKNDELGTVEAYEWALQKCQQAAEKALKAACYTIDSTRERTHYLPSLAIRLDDDRIFQLAVNISGDIGDGMSLRYPDRLSYPSIPNESCTEDKFKRVLKLTKELLEAVEGRYRLNVM